MLNASNKSKSKFFLGISVLLILTLLLVACGDDGEDAEVESEVEVPAAVDATPTVVEEPTPTEEAEAEPVVDETEEMTSTVGITDTESMTDTEAMADSEAMTSTMGITDTEAMTSTLDITTTENITDTEGMISTEGITETAETTPSGEVSATGEAGVRAEELLEYIVLNGQNETIGEIKDLIIGLDSGNVPYAVVDFDEAVLEREEEFDQAVPLSELILSPEAGAVTLNADLQTIQNAPAFNLDTVSDWIRPDWDIDTREYWQANSTMASSSSAAMTGTAMITEEAFIRASDLLDYEVMNPEGEGLGEIEDIMIGLDSQQVKYTVLASGGFLGLGETLFAIPYDAVVIDPEIARVIFNVSEETLENAPGFDTDNWPDTANPRWDVDTREFWDAGDISSTVPGPVITGRTIDEAGVRASQILSATAGTLNEESLGQVADLVIGLNSNQVRYALLATGEDQTLTPVPFYAFVPDVEGITLATTLDGELLTNAPSFSEDEWPDMTNPDWDIEFRDYWLNAGIDVIQPISTPGVATTPVVEPGRRVSELLGADVNLTQQNSSATIEDLIIGLNSQYVNYAILSLEQGLVPVFFPVINFDEQGEATLETEPGVLENIPTLDSETWSEDIVSPTWDLVYRNYWIGSGLGASVDVIEASDLLDRSIINLQGEGLGEVEDFVIGLDNGQVSHAVIEFGGFLGFGESQVPVPMRELKLDPFRQVMILDIGEEALENVGGFDADNRPDISNPDWDNEFQAFWDATFAPMSDQTDDSAPQASIWASDLLGYSTLNLEGDELGEIEDAVVNLQEERLEYVVIGVGGFLGIGEKSVAVPLEALTIDAEQGMVSLDANQQMLEEAPEIDDLAFTLSTPDWDTDLRTYWGIE